jgi:DNA-binding transcriptional ArsR family regulator
MRQSANAKLNSTFAALADPTRRAILARLCQGEASVTELIGPSGLSQPAVSKHLKVLEAAGLVERRRDARFNRCRLRADRLAEAWGWLGDYRAFWERSFDRLEVYVTQLHQLEKGARHDRKKRS